LVGTAIGYAMCGGRVTTRKSCIAYFWEEPVL